MGSASSLAVVWAGACSCACPRLFKARYYDGMEDDYLWQDEEKAEDETTPSDTELDPYDDCLTNVPQDVIDLLMISDDEHEDFEGF
ncbi:hypothetical protein NDU88_000834 [Pleurodeles waltl]|uniref:Secreted protein n=1 Tax=Pleurodeles waltl TaxID=8319 RepID=A0AAV7WLU2_PLEWA|nr:hypothetical protein NDU88_000834 [Pleurodeles waltl]